jgi:hypothetical protein
MRKVLCASAASLALALTMALPAGAAVVGPSAGGHTPGVHIRDHDGRDGRDGRDDHDHDRYRDGDRDGDHDGPPECSDDGYGHRSWERRGDCYDEHQPQHDGRGSILF